MLSHRVGYTSTYHAPGSPVALIQRAIATVPEAHLEVIEDALAFRRGNTK